MYKMIPAFSMPTFISLIHAGYIEQATVAQENTDIAIYLALDGTKYETAAKNIQRAYVPRILKSTLKSLYTQVCHGSHRAQEVVSALYRLGLGVPAFDIASALWSEMPAKGSVRMPDGIVITHKELRGVLKQHLRESFKTAGLYVYPNALVKYHQSLFSYINPVETKRKPKNVLHVQGSTADVCLTYTTYKGIMYLTYATAKLGDVIHDITTQALNCRSIPNKMPNTISKALEGLKVCVYGKFVYTKAARKDFDKSQLDETVNKLIDLDVDSLIELERDRFSFNSADRAFTTKYRQKVQDATDAVALLSTKKRLSKSEETRLQSANRLIAEFKKRESAFTKAKQLNDSELRKQEPAKLLQFVAYDFARVATNVNRTWSGQHFKPVRAPYTSVISKLSELGFDVMPVKFDGVKLAKHPYCYRGTMLRLEVNGVPVWAKE